VPTIASGDLAAVVDPSSGARLTSLSVAGTELLANGGDPLSSGLYPMAPWCGRIRDARFPWRGESIGVPATDGPHALHGLAYLARWNVVDSTLHSVTMRAALDVTPWTAGASVTHTVSVAPEKLRCELTVAASGADFPAQVGWHPCFAGHTDAEFSFALMYLREPDGITDGILVEPTPGPWDDCFVGPNSNPVIRWGDLAVEVSSDCDHWVVYDRVPGLLCVEPQSGPPNAFNHLAATTGPTGATVSGGFAVVGPDRPLTRWMEVTPRRVNRP